MAEKNGSAQGRLALIEGILSGAFFAPMHLHDLLGYHFGQPGLLGLEEEELFDLFVRGAIAAETVFPEAAQGRLPLAWLLGLEDPAPVLAHALVSLRSDRPMLFHRVVYSLPAVREGSLDPGSFELMEDFLTQALGEPMELMAAVEAELETIRNRGLSAAGLEAGQASERVEQEVERVLATPEAAQARTDAQLLAWLGRGQGLAGLEERLAPAVMVEAWAHWVGAVAGCRPDLGLLARLLPRLGLSAPELALHAPLTSPSGQVISADCPYCRQRVSLVLGQQIQRQDDCPHLVFVGTGDEVHLLQVLSHFKLGGDFMELMDSYYASPGDLDLFATIVNDLYEMFSQQGRLKTGPIICEQAPKNLYYLRAYFMGDPEANATRH